MDKVTVIITGLDLNEIENILDESDLADYEYISDNRYLLEYRDLSDLGEAVEMLENAGADIEEV